MSETIANVSDRYDRVDEPVRPSLDSHDATLHYHSCPECYEHAPCRMVCTIEPDLSEERPTGSHMACDACATVADRVARVVYGSEDVEVAVDRLVRARMWPWSPGDGGSPQWWCEECDGSGLGDADDEQGLWWPCRDCRDGHTADPPTLAALVAVASLGCGALRAAEELARVIVGRTPRIVWRVMTRERIDADVPRPTCEAYDSVRALRDLIDIGVHPYSLDASRIVLAVAAI